MTPAERDEVRGLAERHLAYHPGGLRTCTDCLNARAVLRYVPAGDAVDDDAVNVDDVSVKLGSSTNPIVMTVSKPVGRGRKWHAQRCLSTSEARILAHALHAAADAADDLAAIAAALEAL